MKNEIIALGNYRILKNFKFNHLPDHLQDISKPFSEMAYKMAADGGVAFNEETSVGLRKLMEAKDCAVRAML